MTVVMVMFFFPALLVFVAGPAFLALIRALIVFGVTFAAGFSPEQIAAAYGIAEALTAFYNRSRVTPV